MIVFPFKTTFKFTFFCLAANGSADRERRKAVMVWHDVVRQQFYFHFFESMPLFLSLSITLMLSSVGKSSGIVPPNSLMVCRTF